VGNIVSNYEEQRGGDAGYEGNIITDNTGQSQDHCNAG